MYKIANWNLQRPKSKTSKTKLAIDKIYEVNADIIVLTETSEAVNLSELYPFHISTLSYERTPEENWVTIWSKWEITKKIETFDNYRTVSGIINTPFGDILIFGTIIPYHNAGVSGVRYGNLNYKIWEYHEKDLYTQSQNWETLIETENLPLFVIGDFNQSRFNNKGYGTHKVRQILSDILNNLDLKCLTELDFSLKHLTADPIKGKIRNNVDHICISNKLVNKMKKYEVSAWDQFTELGKFMSDHNGVFIDFEI
jgi:exonuclease III